MKYIFLIAVLVIPVHAAPQWLKRVAVAGACAASMLDYSSTVSAVNRGAYESNPLLAGPHGPRYGGMLGLKLGACATQVVVSELVRHHSGMDRALIGASAAQIGLFGWSAHHNSGIAR